MDLCLVKCKKKRLHSLSVYEFVVSVDDYENKAFEDKQQLEAER